MGNIRITYNDNTQEFLQALEKAKVAGLEAIGLTAETYAKKVITEAGAVDTGLLRNSITYAVAGAPAHVKTYKAYKRKPGEKALEVHTYEGVADGEPGECVYVGTNVVYARGIELGTHRKAGAVHFLQRAATDPAKKYKQLMKSALENAEK